MELTSMISIDKQEVPKENQASANAASAFSTDKNFSIMADTKHILHLVSAGVSTRIQLFFLETQDLLHALIIKMITLVALVLLIIFSIVSLNIAIVIYFWDTYRTEAAWGSVAFFILLITLASLYLSKQKSLKYFKSFFSETVGQIKKDLEQFKDNNNG